jgi:hypothetical protein
MLGVLDHVVVYVQTATPSIPTFLGLSCAVERTLRTSRSFFPWNPGSTAAPAVATAAAAAAAAANDLLFHVWLCGLGFRPDRAPPPQTTDAIAGLLLPLSIADDCSMLSPVFVRLRGGMSLSSSSSHGETTPTCHHPPLPRDKWFPLCIGDRKQVTAHC